LSKKYKDDGFVFEYNKSHSRQIDMVTVRANNGQAASFQKNELGVNAMNKFMSENAFSSSAEKGEYNNKLRNIKEDRKSTRLNSSHLVISYAVFCLKKKNKKQKKINKEKYMN